MHLDIFPATPFLTLPRLIDLALISVPLNDPSLARTRLKSCGASHTECLQHAISWMKEVRGVQLLTLVDMRPIGGDNAGMVRIAVNSTHVNNGEMAGKAVFFLVACFFPVALGSAAPPLEFCENRTPDQQLGAARSSSSGNSSEKCVPLVEKRERASPGEGDEENARQVKIENLQAEVTGFLQKYNQFLECCKTDLGELRTVEELGDEVGDLLAVAQAGLFSEHMKIRGWTLRELLPPVAKARADLKTLRTKLEHVGTGRAKLGELGYEESAREAGRLREMEESIERDFRSPSLPTGPKTGTSIGASSSVGGAIGKTPRTGSQIGAEGAVGADLGANPKTGRDIGATGPTGFEIGATGRAGADIGESRLNSDQSAVGSSLQQSTVGSNISDTTVGSSLSQSTIGSSLGDTSIGSSFGGSSVGSSLQNRGTSH